MLPDPQPQNDSKSPKQEIYVPEKWEIQLFEKGILDYALGHLLALRNRNNGKMERYFISVVVKVLNDPAVTYRKLKYRYDRCRVTDPIKLDKNIMRLLYPNFHCPDYVAVFVDSCDDDDWIIADPTVRDNYKAMTTFLEGTSPIPTDIFVIGRKNSNTNVLPPGRNVESETEKIGANE